MVSGLFLDVKGAFPSVIISHLAHILKTKGIQRKYISWIIAKCAPRTSTFAFDGFQSQPLPISVGLPQGCPLSPLLFLFYNAALNDIPRRKKGEDGALFVDDTMFLASAPSFTLANEKLERIMNGPEGALDWAHDHNSDFEATKSALIGFTHRRETDPNNPSSMRLTRCPPIHIRGSPVPVVENHRFLGVHLDRRLSFKHHAITALTKGTLYVSALQ